MEINNVDDLWSYQVPQTSRADRGNIRRAFDPSLHPELGVDGCRTLYEGLRQGASINPLGPCLGFRAMSTTGFPTPYIYSSYTECVARVDAFAAGMDSLHLVEKNDEGILVLCLYIKNCMEWVLAQHAIFCLGGATAPMYDTLGHDSVRFVLRQTGAKSVVCSRAELSTLCQAKASGECPNFHCAILVDGVVPEAAQMAKDAGFEVISFAKVEAMGAQKIATQGHEHSPPDAKDIATFCYTSGTTGDPKGAMLTHENFVSAIAGMQAIFKPEAFDRHLSYLPLAHIFELIVSSQILIAGASIAFYRGDPLYLIEDIQACRPTMFPAAPRVLNKIHDKIQAGMHAAGGLKKKIFDAGLAAKTKGLTQGHLKHAIFDRLIFDKIKKALGMDCIRFLVSGSAPLSDSVMIFFRCMLGVVVVEGYGQTEGTAAATIGHPDDISTVGHVGGPTGATEIVLMDVPEMGYFHTDKFHDGKPCQGRGEICVRGPNVFKGYYKDEAKTKETIDEEGWLHSGDIGLWTKEGQLKIVDRKKNIFKLAQGEYVAPEKIENVIMRSMLIAQCFVYGDSFQSTLVAVVVPDEEPVKAWAAKQDSLAKLSFKELCETTELNEAIMAEIQRLANEQFLNGFETPKSVFLESTLFTAENDLATPTFKLKRDKLRTAYERQIAEMYAKLPAPKSKL